MKEGKEMQFITLTAAYDGKPVMINIDNIDSMEHCKFYDGEDFNGKNCTSIYTELKDFTVDESIEEIQKKLEELRNDRG